MALGGLLFQEKNHSEVLCPRKAASSPRMGVKFDCVSAYIKLFKHKLRLASKFKYLKRWMSTGIAIERKFPKVQWRRAGDYFDY